MEQQSCSSKPPPRLIVIRQPPSSSPPPRISTIRQLPPPPPPSMVPDYPWSAFNNPSQRWTTTRPISDSSGRIPDPHHHHRRRNVEVFYRRNDPSNRSYRMKKRPPAQVYHCVQCDKHIKYPSKITEHIRKHTGEKPHICHICQQSFSQAHTLKQHMQSHLHEKPYKCSFCSAAFLHICDKNEHEAQHMHHADHPESMDDNNAPNNTFIEVEEVETIEVEEEGVVTGGHQICQIYECSEMCGFQSYDQSEVIEHMSMGHQHSYETVCWHDGTGTVVEGGSRGGSGVRGGQVGRRIGRVQRRDTQDSDGGRERKMQIGVIPVQNGMIVQNFNNEPQPIYQYEYVEEQFVPEVATESIIDNNQQPCTSNSHHNYHQYDQNTVGAGGPSSESPIVTGEEMIYEEEGEEIVEEQQIQEEQKVIKTQNPDDVHVYEEEEIIIQELEEGEVEDGEVVEIGNIEDDEGEEQEKVRVFINPNPPKRGTKSLRDHHDAHEAMMEVVVDASTLEMVAPVRLIQQQGRRGYSQMGPRRGTKKADNLDWIIDAVAKGVDVNEASPHHRKKPTLHKCEYCGKVDKYPSKIRAHMRTHTGEKPFKCDICGMTFSQKTPMRLHLRRHLDQKPYECEVEGCKERFVSGAIRRMHFEKKHLNKKKYVCVRGCGRVFSSAYNQRHHEKKCAQNTYLQWVEDERVDSGGEEESIGEYVEDEEIYDETIDPQIVEQNRVEQHFMEEPIFLHQ